MKKTNLYILIFDDFDAIKIGKADDISNRVNTLKKWWGEPDYAESYALEIDIDKVFLLEKVLHSILKEFFKRFRFRRRENGDI
ncbi:GIY-YIG nuclease family protein [Grimontia sp. NTOU-MAR1]|uniref:GIY-YIG nuclease family protein n=1 Tax=Grimontia sp. NTOU-MAR1 TaxID=3111011 RepID=UPI002DB75A7F|nr:GIY-YIG nuclease family protein [Grimontia sp. NTOU-MAR1]WRV98403.1 GIY-YIG nuclease family protein [Grimontia sp. NTOU-MAR1]